GTQMRAAANGAPRLRLASTLGDLYVFTTGSGYALLPADDAAPALLGYSDTGTFDPSANPNLAYWVEYLNSELAYLADHPEAGAGETAAPDRAPIAPMTATRWNQEAPYNDLCPTFNGRRCVTGCVATAMSQAMKYHNHPTVGRGTHSYDWTLNGQTEKLTFDYGSTTFDWAAMDDRYDDKSSDEAKTAVATLMYAAGVSVDMGYTPGESSASSVKMAAALIDYFDYDRSLWLGMRDAYPKDRWEEMIYNELAEGRPVLYGGQGTAGGHQFICDGYSEDGFFHINWGWGGMSDGYFLLTALNPSSLGVGGGAGGFNSDQDAVFGMQPAREGSQPTYIMYNTADFKVTPETGELDSQFEFKGGFYNYSLSSIPEGSNIGIRFEPDGGGEPVYRAITTGELGSYYGYSGFTSFLPAYLFEEGTYTVTPVYRVDGGEWQEMPTFISCSGELHATVSGSTITFATPEAATVNVHDISVKSPIYKGYKTPLSFAVTNPGTDEFMGDIYPTLLDASGEAVARSEYLPIDLTGGASESYTELPATFSALSGKDFAAGTYTLVFRAEDGRDLSTPVTVEVKEVTSAPSITVSDFKLLTPSPVSDKKSVKFSVRIDCTEGYYAGALRVVIFPLIYGQSVSSVDSKEFPTVYLSAGESETVTADLDMSAHENGNYFAILYNGNTQASGTQLTFELKDIYTSITEVGTDEPATETIYDLRGISHTRPLAPGIYILR
ncbi:MAG: C10 family peptidase, partial [Duncaniella sp.]|nr:C10 family peptidase [Duncaniella sp.]